jgi:hypothetical protein
LRGRSSGQYSGRGRGRIKKKEEKGLKKEIRMERVVEN